MPKKHEEPYIYDPNKPSEKIADFIESTIGGVVIGFFFGTFLGILWLLGIQA